MTGTLYRVPRPDQRAAFVARFDLLGPDVRLVARADQLLAADVELPHLWVFPGTSTLWCQTCDKLATLCEGDHRAADAAHMARLSLTGRNQPDDHH